MWGGVGMATLASQTDNSHWHAGSGMHTLRTLCSATRVGASDRVACLYNCGQLRDCGLYGKHKLLMNCNWWDCGHESLRAFTRGEAPASRHLTTRCQLSGALCARFPQTKTIIVPDTFHVLALPALATRVTFAGSSVTPVAILLTQPNAFDPCAKRVYSGADSSAAGHTRPPHFVPGRQHAAILVRADSLHNISSN